MLFLLTLIMISAAVFLLLLQFGLSVIQTQSAVCSVHSALLCKINRCVYFYISVYTSVRGDGTLSFMSEIVHPKLEW